MNPKNNSQVTKLAEDQDETINVVEASATVATAQAQLDTIPILSKEQKIEQPAKSALPVASAGTPFESDLRGTIFAQKYEILEVLGRGGMSVVYKARHTVLDKIVAVKVLQFDRLQNEVSLRRFKQEAQAVCSLNHPSIVGVHDFGENEEGTPYLEMDFVEGETLSELIKNGGPLPLERFLDIMEQVSAGLTVAHQNGIVHRDLKPSNIMVNKSTGKEQARIVDFGIAKVAGNTSESGQQLTQTGEIFGSPLYMSPEQCTGSIVDNRADIYSLGCVMYESLSGKVPFFGESVFETIHKHQAAPPPPLVAPQIPDAFKAKIETLLLRCLAKSPEDRFQNIHELESELRALSLKTKPGILGILGGAWDLASAKRRASRKNKLPLMIVTLMTVSVFSMISVMTLFSADQKLNEDIEKANHSRLILTEISMAQEEFIKFGKAVGIYSTVRLLYPNTSRELYAQKEVEKYGDATQQALKQIEAVLGDNQTFLNKIRKLMRRNEQLTVGRTAQKNAASDDTARIGSPLPDMSNPANRQKYVKYAVIAGESQQLLKEMTDYVKKVEREERGQLSGTQEWVKYLSLLCIALNGSVVAALIFYFARGTPQRLRKLAEQAAQLSRKHANVEGRANNDEVADLDNVLHELATALSEAEEREKILLQKLKNKEESEKSPRIL